MTSPHPRYAFGANWTRYLDRDFDAERERIARRHLLGFLEREDLAGMSFLDVGSGSGIHSLAAFTAGAERVVSFDYDPLSVEATRRLHAMAGAPANWTVLQGSALDEEFCAALGRFDIVYSWGVLHHTGDLWRAFDVVAGTTVSPGGRFYIALYDSQVHLDPSPGQWLEIKRRYNAAGPVTRLMMEARHLWSVACLRRWSNLWRLPRIARDYRKSRGMALWTDARDWLGGYPMEFCSMPEVAGRAAAHGLDLIGLRFGEWNTEYLFAPPGHGQPVIAGDSLVPPPTLHSVDDLPDQPFFIFGTAQGATLLGRRALARNKPLAGFIDIAATGRFLGRPILSVDAFARDWPSDCPVVLSNRYVLENTARLRQAGHQTIHNGHPLVLAMVMGRR